MKLIQCRDFSFPDSNDHSLYPPLGRPLQQGSQLRVWKRISNRQEGLVQPWDRQLTLGQDPWATRPECPVANAKFSATLTNLEMAKQKDAVVSQKAWWGYFRAHVRHPGAPCKGFHGRRAKSWGLRSFTSGHWVTAIVLNQKPSWPRERWLSSFLFWWIDLRLLRAPPTLHILQAVPRWGLGGRWGSKPSPSSICQSGHVWSCVHLPLCPWPHTLLSLPTCNSHASPRAFALAVLFARKALPHLSFSMTHCPMNNDNSQYLLPDPHTMPSRGTVNFVCFVCWSIPSA